MSEQQSSGSATPSGPMSEAGVPRPQASSPPSAGHRQRSRRGWMLLALVVAGLVFYLTRQRLQPESLPPDFASSNGRIEAVEIDIATKIAGRIEDILVNEGDFVTAGQVLVQMDVSVLNAQLREAKAELRQAETSVETAKSTVAQRESERAAQEAVVVQRDAELELATKSFARTERLVKTGAMSAEDFDTAKSALFSAKAGLSRAKADVAAADAAISTAKSQAIASEASVGAAKATIERIEADIADSALKAPRDGRIQYRIAQPGEVLAAGGKVLNMVDLADVYMTFFLPTAEAGRLAIGSDARLILDAAPHLVIPAKVTFVADVAQFTPKTVETAEERQKLMFRVKAHISPELLRKYIRTVKTGLPGMAYVRLDPEAAWPVNLEIKLPR